MANNPMYRYKEHDFSTGPTVVEGEISHSINHSLLIGSVTEEYGEDYCNVESWIRSRGLKVGSKYRIIVEEIK